MCFTSPFMQLADFDFHLPEDRIALHPASPRDAARLLVVRPGMPLEDRIVRELPQLLRPGDALVFNDTRVIPAALEGVRRGEFAPDQTIPPDSFAGLSERVATTIAALEAIDPAEVDGFIGRDMAFAIGGNRMAFSAEDFLLPSSQPNFYFHATTAYDLLRWKGLALGKRDFMGTPVAL